MGFGSSNLVCGFYNGPVWASSSEVQRIPRRTGSPVSIGYGFSSHTTLLTWRVRLIDRNVMLNRLSIFFPRFEARSSAWGRPRRCHGGSGGPGVRHCSRTGAGCRGLRGDLRGLLHRRVRGHTVTHIRSHRLHDRGNGGHRSRPRRQHSRGLHNCDHGRADPDGVRPAAPSGGT